tara:strand:+ start:343 stop:648 length:306 start_codon:yes stop_codon:yes gene_type:complete
VFAVGLTFMVEVRQEKDFGMIGKSAVLIHDVNLHIPKIKGQFHLQSGGHINVFKKQYLLGQKSLVDCRENLWIHRFLKGDPSNLISYLAGEWFEFEWYSGQ